MYADHVEPLKEQLQRVPKQFPRLTIKNRKEIAEITDFHFDDFVIEGYEPMPAIKMKMAV